MEDVSDADAVLDNAPVVPSKQRLGRLKRMQVSQQAPGDQHHSKARAARPMEAVAQQLQDKDDRDGIEPMQSTQDAEPDADAPPPWLPPDTAALLDSPVRSSGGSQQQPRGIPPAWAPPPRQPGDVPHPTVQEAPGQAAAACSGSPGPSDPAQPQQQQAAADVGGTAAAGAESGDTTAADAGDTAAAGAGNTASLEDLHDEDMTEADRPAATPPPAAAPAAEEAGEAAALEDQSMGSPSRRQAAASSSGGSPPLSTGQPGSVAEAAAGSGYWDEEDELAERIHREHQGKQGGAGRG